MTDSKDPRSGRVHIDVPQRCHRCGDMFVGPKGCRASAYEEPCFPELSTEKRTVDRHAETLSDCTYCGGTGLCPGCGGCRMVEQSVKSSQLEHPIDQAAQTKRKP